MRNYIIIAVLTLGAIGLMAFGGGSSSSDLVADAPDLTAHGTSGSSMSTESREDKSQESSEVELAPDFTLESIGGGKIALSDYRGKKPVILDFWASWCPNCRRDMPVLNEYYNTYKEDIEVIGVNLHESKSAVDTYIQKAGIDFPIVYDPASIAANRFGVSYTNFHVLINKDGSIFGTVPGDIAESHVIDLIAANQE